MVALFIYFFSLRELYRRSSLICSGNANVLGTQCGRSAIVSRIEGRTQTTGTRLTFVYNKRCFCSFTKNLSSFFKLWCLYCGLFFIFPSLWLSSHLIEQALRSIDMDHIGYDIGMTLFWFCIHLNKGTKMFNNVQQSNSTRFYLILCFVIEHAFWLNL